MATKPPAFDKRQLRSRFNRTAASYDAAAILERKVGDELLERLDVVKLVPARILDAGCGTGYCTRLLAKRYRRAAVVGLDIAAERLQQARHREGWFSRSRFTVSDAERLPFADSGFDMVVSNLALPWLDPAVAFAEFLRVLRPGGLFVFTTVGPDTLQELRAAWRQVDDTEHVHTFLDMHDVGDALVRVGFADPVMDVERYVLTFADVASAVADLRLRGVQNLHPDRVHHLTARKSAERFRSAYAATVPDGRVPLTYEIIYGHAWTPASRRATDGTVRIPVERIGRRR